VCLAAVQKMPAIKRAFFESFVTVQEWIALYVDELHADWELAQNGNDLNLINPLQ
jgi:hypothetical protein